MKMADEMEDKDSKTPNSPKEARDVRHRCSKFRITIEPPIFLFALSQMIEIIVNQNQYLDKVCQVNFNLNASLCSEDNGNNTTMTDDLAGISVGLNQTASSVVTDRVQTYVSTLRIYSSLIQCFPSIIFVLFLGPWSDRKGRKPLLIFPVLGHALSVLVRMACHYFESWPAEYLLLADVPANILGGWNTFVMAFSSYTVDITPEETRTSRISLNTGIISITGPLGSFFSKYIYEYGGYWSVYGTALALSLFSLFYIIFFVAESRTETSRHDADGSADDDGTSCSDILKNVWRCFTVTFKARPGHKRACVTILLVMMFLSRFSNSPDFVEYLYARKKFSWDAPDYAIYRTAYTSLLMFGTLALLPLLSGYFKINDILIGIMALLGDITSYLTIAFATSSLMMYMASTGIVISYGISIVLRSMLSKLVATNELSYVYCVAACLESINPLMTSPVINLIYAATLDSFPGCVFLFGSSLDVILIILLIIVFVLERNKKIPSNISNDEQGVDLKHRNSNIRNSFSKRVID